jgi:UPF0716 protein FxsA
MVVLLVLAFVIVPLVELTVIIQAAQAIGVGWTIVLLVADSVLGAWLLKREGRRVWRQFREALAASRWPGDEVAQGGLVIIGGTLLLTPGFVTDGVGFLMLLPPSRAILSRLIRARVTPLPVQGYQYWRSRRHPGEPSDRPAERGDSGHPPLDVEVIDIERDPQRPDDGGPLPSDGDGEGQDRPPQA